MKTAGSIALGYQSVRIGNSEIFNADCMQWLREVPENSIHAVVTDPPYGVKEYELDQLNKLQSGRGGVWRIPPSFDGHMRSPLPRFTALDREDRGRLRNYFVEWSGLVLKALRPGGHVFIATNAFLAELLYESVVEGGLEFRGQIIRQVRTLRGGDRPKNAEQEFPGVSSIPKGCYEPWGLFRKSLGKLTVGQCLRNWETGGLRRNSSERPFEDLIPSERTPKAERKLADHPSLKPQSFMRRLVHAALPLGKGTVLDPFMGAGSTIAACEALGVRGIGIERVPEYFDLASKAILSLKQVQVVGEGYTPKCLNGSQPSLF